MVRIDKFMLKQIFGSLFLRIVGIIITVIQVPILMDCLNKENYGIWISLFNIINWISIFDFGITHGLRNKLSELYTLDDNVRIKQYLLNSVLLLFFVFAIIFVIFIIRRYIFRRHNCSFVVGDAAAVVVCEKSDTIFIFRVEC